MGVDPDFYDRRHRMLVYCSAALVGRVAAVFACPLLYRRVFREAAPRSERRRAFGTAYKTAEIGKRRGV